MMVMHILDLSNHARGPVLSNAYILNEPQSREVTRYHNGRYLYLITGIEFPNFGRNLGNQTLRDDWQSCTNCLMASGTYSNVAESCADRLRCLGVDPSMVFSRLAPEATERLLAL